MKMLVAVAVVGIVFGGCKLMVESDAIDSVTNVIALSGSETSDEIAYKAAHVVPTHRQMEYLKTEFLAFIHWGPNAFSSREWGTGKEREDLFNPPTVDTDQWCETMKAAGMRMVVLTTKHHDGYCLWQSRYTKHSVAGSPWKGGKGDVLKDLAASCKKYDMKLGVYLSPADLYQMESKDGLYGNLSKYTERTIPRQIEGRPFADKRTFTFKVDDYNEYFLNQLFELLTEYGPIHEVWFDGAHPKRKGDQTYTFTSWYKLIRTLAPDAIIFGKGPDARWCGNESGRTRESEWNVIPLDVHPDVNDWPDFRKDDIASREKLVGAKYLYYYPAEVNTSIRHGWFFRDDEHQRVRDAENVFDVYERAVGGNATFLLNIPPNREGKYSKRDVESLVGTGRRIRATYHTSVSEGASGPKETLDGNDETYWQPAGLAGDFEIVMKKPGRVNRFMLKESILTKGQRVEKHALDAWVDGTWKEVASATTIGHKRILRFPTVETDKFRIRIIESRATPTICRASAHYYAEQVNSVEIRLSSNNKVTLVAGIPAFAGKAFFRPSNGQRIYYTLDGSDPTDQSKIYKESFDMPVGGIVKARAIVGKRSGAVETRVLGYPIQNWKVFSSSESDNERRRPAKKAFDGSAYLGWRSKPSDGEKHLAIDLSSELEITGFTYQAPHLGDKPIGLVEKYRFETSVDGKTWSTVSEGEFGNIVNDPSKRTVRFKATKVRYVKLVGVSSALGSKQMAIHELEILGEQRN